MARARAYPGIPGEEPRISLDCLTIRETIALFDCMDERPIMKNMKEELKKALNSISIGEHP